MSIRTKIISIAALALLLAACGGNSTTKTPQKQVDIERLGWILENRDPSRASSGATAFLRPFMTFADTDLKASDFASIEVTSPADTTWVYDEAADLENRFSGEDNAFFFSNLYSSSLDNGSHVALGNYTFKVILKNGNTATKRLLVPAPASAATDGYRFAYTEDYIAAANPPSSFVALPKRASIESAALDLQTSRLDVTFSVDDERIYSGWLRLYNAEGDHIGYTGDFRDYKTGALMSQLNDGAALLSNGDVNTLSVPAEQLGFFEPEVDSVSDVASVLVVLTDGEQYEGTDSSFDTMSTSSQFEISVNP